MTPHPCGSCDPAPTHAVIMTVGTLGDMHPFLRAARALQARGHRVTLLGPAPHAPHVAKAGIPFHPMGTEQDFKTALADPDLWHPRKGFGVVWRSMFPSLATLPAFVAALPPGERCLLLVHPLVLPFAALARAMRPGIRVVGGYLAPSNLRTTWGDPLLIGPLRIPSWLPQAWRRGLWAFADATVLDPVAVPDLNAQRQALGLAPVRHLVAHMHEAADLSLTFFPEWFAPTQPDWPQPLHRGGFPLYEPTQDAALPDRLARFLAAGEAPIVFTPGTGHRQAGGYFARALAAVQRLGRRAVFLTPERRQVPAALPQGVLWQPYVPLRTLLPHVALLVHHGGIGTTAEALRAGVPQLVMPMAHDQFDNAARVQALGVGAVLRGSRVRAPRLADALQALLAAPPRAACEAAARSLAHEPGWDGFCEVLETEWARSD